MRSSPSATRPSPSSGWTPTAWPNAQSEFEVLLRACAQLKYLVRCMTKKGQFDETSTQPLWHRRQNRSVGCRSEGRRKIAGGLWREPHRQPEYPPSRRNGAGIRHRDPKGQGCGWQAMRCPWTRRAVSWRKDPAGGMHTVEVAVLDKSGNGEIFLRDLELKKSDWFTVGNRRPDPVRKQDGRAGRTPRAGQIPVWRRHEHRGPPGLLYARQVRKRLVADGERRYARRFPLDEIFSNFLDKSPRRCSDE